MPPASSCAHQLRVCSGAAGSAVSVAHPTFVLIAVVAFVASFAISLGPVTWVMVAEIFPNEQRALALSIVAYIAVREHQRIRSKPAFQQSLLVFAALVFYEFVVFAIDGWTGHPVTSPLRWLHCLTGAIVWPPAAAILSFSEGRLA